MDISIEVIDGIHGHPAEGVAVSFVSHIDDTEIERIDQRTDHLGRVRYSGRRAGMANGKTCIIEIDAQIYFATLGIDCCQRKVVVFFRPAGPDDVYDIRSLVAPSMQSICCMRRPGAASPQSSEGGDTL